MDRSREAFAPRIYYLHPLMAGPIPEWTRHLMRCSEMGFDHLGCAPLFAPGSDGDIFVTSDFDRVHPALHATGAADDVIRELAKTCDRFGLKLILDVVLGRAAADCSLVTTAPHWFLPGPERVRIDPRSELPRPGVASARFDNPAAGRELADWWTERLGRLARAGVAGFRCTDPQHVPPPLWRDIIQGVRRDHPDCRFLAWTPGLAWSTSATLRGIGFDAACSSLAWWNERATWFVEEHELLRQIGSVVACPEAPFGHRLARRFGPTVDLQALYPHMLRLAATTGSGLLIPMGFEFASVQDMDSRRTTPDDLAEAEATGPDLTAPVTAANELCARLACLRLAGEMRSLAPVDGSVTALLRSDHPDARHACKPIVVLVNTEPRPNPLPLGLDPLPPSAGAGFGQPEPLEGVCEPAAALAASEVRVVRLRRSTHVSAPMEITAGKAARTLPRIAIESITPAVDGGRFPAKRVVGETIAIEADVFTDGHEVLAVELLWKAADEKDWRAQRMQFASNDRWRTDITPDRIGRYVFTIEAWWDEYATFCRDLEIKRKAGADVALEIAEGRALLTRMQARARGAAAAVLRDAVGALTDADVGASIDILLGAGLREAVAACSPRHFRCRRRPVLAIEVERPQARFASWYELFPRSATNDPSRHGTFADVVAQLPQIRDMGFDVLYFPPIHPIGRVNRKGRNNSLHAQPGDLGSPYAIGSREGGHDAIHPCLGTIEDFRRLRDAAAEHGLEIALDFAIQCAPDHPWLTAHPGWFRWRPDGSIRFAENPPKKYEDIVNVDFYADGAIPDLWVALRDVVLYWIGEGVRTFRVDNPHTKPLPFWEWLIADVRSHHPDVIFLSEAFTRPKMMYRLAKTGFSQSYTYFTWRNTKQELTDYLVELTTTDVKDYFRPHFFVNTPDINPYFLQTSGRPGFLIRAALAATLSGLWGMYSGFELCESAPLPGREEYLDSEKYEIRVRDRSAPGNITSEIAKLNRIRRTNPALQTHLNLRFYNAFNDQVLYFGKAEPGARDMVLAAISLDPHRVQDAAIEVPLWHWGLPDSGSIAVEDLVRDHSFVWSGKLQRVVLDPAELPYAIWRLSPLPGA